MAASPTPRASPGERLLAQWRRLRALPGGRRIFSALLGRTVPYTGTIHPYVEALEPGYARVRMRDRRAVRNHLDSVHAVALMNLAEVASGLALTVALPAEMRSILTALSIEYLKKARGTLTAECRCPVPAPVAERREYTIEAVITDAEGDAVARAEARWLVGPR
jgi:acyl-coenzyme A thioesterase PaaI-like protein